MAKMNWLVIVAPKKQFRETHRAIVVVCLAKSRAAALREYEFSKGDYAGDWSEYKKPVAVPGRYNEQIRI